MPVLSTELSRRRDACPFNRVLSTGKLVEGAMPILSTGKLVEGAMPILSTRCLSFQPLSFQPLSFQPPFNPMPVLSTPMPVLSTPTPMPVLSTFSTPMPVLSTPTPMPVLSTCPFNPFQPVLSTLSFQPPVFSRRALEAGAEDFTAGAGKPESGLPALRSASRAAIRSAGMM
jgi:hypothetical protein